ncbi:MAG TPA: hypothetical protein V6C86_18980 [Oculatellaceae cyanobacterium]
MSHRGCRLIRQWSLRSLWATVHGLAILCLDGQLATFVDDGRDSVKNLVDGGVSRLIAGDQSKRG